MKRTVVIHGLLKPLVPLLEHLTVDVNYIHGRLPVGIVFPSIVQYPQRNVSGTTPPGQYTGWVPSHQVSTIRHTRPSRVYVRLET